MTSTPAHGSQEWLDLVAEEIIDPERRIIDPHHHLWHDRRGNRYLLDDLWRDTEAGHNVEKTVFLECGEAYRDSGPEELRSVGETEFVATQARASAEGEGKATIAAIISRADLTLGEAVEDVLAAHAEAGQGLFRGIRHSGARDPHPEALTIPGRAPEGLYAMPEFRVGLRTLGELGYTYDTWHYHHQNAAFAELARAVPGTVMVLDHFGTPLGVGPYEGKREEIFSKWRKDIADIASCQNVVAKIGGLAMPDNGFGWHTRERPPTSDEFVAAQERYYDHTIECFGPDRCMFESNFPVDRWSVSYPVLWNGLKKIAAKYTDDEQDAMFYRNAARVYRI
jgi:predicted TIM-barrel fold metal-dependent hydrolase